MTNLRTDDFDYHLPPELIAQTPVDPRDSSRLLVIHRATGALEHRTFRDIVDYLRPGDLLIANDSRVLHGRLWARKSTGGRVEFLLLRSLEDGWWEALARPAHRLRPGQTLALETKDEGRKTDSNSSFVLRPSSHLEIGPRTESGAITIRFDAPAEEVLAQYGTVPLPPYIHTPLADPERYQTVYSRVTGSAAAPTAGLHFTPQLLDRITQMGVRLAFITLHVGTDTFRPVQVERIADHDMHSEFVSVPAETAQAIVAAKREGRRVIAVGTTAVRSLESWAAAVLPSALSTQHSALLAWSGWTRLFIYPGYQFRVVDALLTNFHLPRSTLLMLISAFAGRDLVQHAYDEAIAHHYRFFSFGDASLFL